MVKQLKKLPQHWAIFTAFALMMLAPAFLSDFRLNLLGKFMALAILALGLDLIWGYAGILSLGHGLFFGLGAYGFAMYLKLESTGGKLPDFMSWSGLEKLPWFWHPFQRPGIALAMAVLAPLAVAALLGFLIFRNRIRGVYFSILTQALALVFVILLVGQQPYTGGTNGITNLKTIFGHSLAAPATQKVLYSVTAFSLLMVYLFCRRLAGGRFGRILIAIRDGENRLRFAGYNPVTYKVFIFAVSAGIAGLAGALFVPQVGIIAPAMMGIAPSIEMAVWVAVGGRGTLTGAIIGAILVNLAKSSLSESYPDAWLLLLGALFIAVVMLFPEGLMGIGKRLAQKFQDRPIAGYRRLAEQEAAADQAGG